MATIAEKSRTKEIIDRLQNILDTASPVPLAAGKIMVFKDEVQSLLSELASQMEMEIKTYHEVNDRRGKIINEAKKEAEKIIYQAEQSASRMRVSKRSTNVAPLDYNTLTEEERGALANANEIYAASLIYTDEMLTEVTDVITDAYNNIRADYEVILQAMEEKLNTIVSNREELMTGLQEMETEDRSQQILEIGQLLSNELYNERMKRHMNSDEYDDGSVQLRLDFEEAQARQEQELFEKEQAAIEAQQMAQKAAAELEKMRAERDALQATVEKMKQGGMAEAMQFVKSAAKEEVKKDAPKTVEASMSEEVEDEEEYEIVYVTEDELEEGEEYEIEYVDDLEDEEEFEVEYIEEKKEEAVAETPKATLVPAPEKEEEAPKATLVPAPEKKTEKVEEIKDAVDELGQDDDIVPIIPHFKKSEKIASAPAEQVAHMAKAVINEPKYSGLISRAVANREKAQEEAVVTVEQDYVQATMQFDEDNNPKNF